MNNIQQFLNTSCIVDVETTSADYNVAKIIEIGTYCTIDGEVYTTNQLIHPGEKITPLISSITAITNKMLEDQPSIDSVRHDYEALLSRFDYLIAHNSIYDATVIKRHLDISTDNWICTLRLAKHALGKRDDVELYNLTYLRYYFELDIPDSFAAHRAANDAYVTRLILEKLIDILIDDGAVEPDQDIGKQLKNIMDKPIIYSRMPFGKYKGKLMTEVPMDYWNWAIKNMPQIIEGTPEYDRDLAASVEYALNVLLDL